MIVKTGLGPILYRLSLLLGLELRRILADSEIAKQLQIKNTDAQAAA